MWTGISGQGMTGDHVPASLGAAFAIPTVAPKISPRITLKQLRPTIEVFKATYSLLVRPGSLCPVNRKLRASEGHTQSSQ
jgi:hypothetical protein